MTIVSKLTWNLIFKENQDSTGDTLVFKMHAPISAHHAIHVNCVLIALLLQSVQPDRAGEQGWEKWASIGAKMCWKHCAITWHSLLLCWYHSNSVDWTIGNWICQVSFREEVNWWNYWKWKWNWADIGGYCIVMPEATCSKFNLPVEEISWRFGVHTDEWHYL